MLPVLFELFEGKIDQSFLHNKGQCSYLLLFKRNFFLSDFLYSPGSTP